MAEDIGLCRTGLQPVPVQLPEDGAFVLEKAAKQANFL
jgi:hypothetical protein